MLIKAGYNWNYVAIDGKNRVIEERKTFIIVSTVDKAQMTHLIGFMVMTKGEREDEILKGLLILRRHIQVVHQATYDLPPTAKNPYKIPGMEHPAPPPRDWVWDPHHTNNDGARGFFSSWEKFRL